MESKKYSNPPIIEAVCEFQFDPTSLWDPTIPGLFYEKINKSFPKKKTLKIHKVAFSFDTKEGVRQQQQFTIRERAQFLRNDEKLFVQVDENLLAINHLRPYSSWQEFYSAISNTYKLYQEVAKPKGINRIGLRFINQIEIPKPSIKLEDYLNFYPSVGVNLPQTLGPIVLSTMFIFENGRDIAKVQLTSKPVKDEKLVFLLDIDYFLAKSNAISLQEILNWVENAHAKIETIFEGSLTDATKDLFK